MRAIYITAAAVIFNLAVIFVATFMPVSPEAQADVWRIFDFNNFLSTAFFSGVTITGFAAIVVSAATRNLTPVVLWLYGSVFWTSYLNAQDILMQFHMPATFLAILTVGILIAFVVGALQIASGGGWEYYM